MSVGSNSGNYNNYRDASAVRTTVLFRREGSLSSTSPTTSSAPRSVSQHSRIPERVIPKVTDYATSPMPRAPQRQPSLAAAVLSPKVLPLTAHIPSVLVSNSRVPATYDTSLMAAIRAASLAVSAMEDEMKEVRSEKVTDDGLNQWATPAKSYSSHRHVDEEGGGGSRLHVATAAAQNRIAAAEAVLRYSMRAASTFEGYSRRPSRSSSSHNKDEERQHLSQLRNARGSSTSRSKSHPDNHREERRHPSPLRALEHRMDTLQWQLAAHQRQMSNLKGEVVEQIRSSVSADRSDRAVGTVVASHSGHNDGNGKVTRADITPSRHAGQRLKFDSPSVLYNDGIIDARQAWSATARYMTADEWHPDGFRTEPPSRHYSNAAPTSTRISFAHWDLVRHGVEEPEESAIQSEEEEGEEVAQTDGREWPNAATMALLAAAEQRLLDGSSFLSP